MSSRSLEEGSAGGKKLASPPDLTARAAARTLRGHAVLRKVGFLRLPVYELTIDGDVLARFGRPGWWRIFFGSGQSIELADGTRWRLRAVGLVGAICPVIVDRHLKKVALATPHPGGYGLNGRDWAYVFFPSESGRFVRANHWIVRERGEDIALVSRSPWGITASSPMPLSAAILALTLVRYGIPGESGLGVPRLRWGSL